MEKIALRISEKVDGKAVNLSLTESEVVSGASICERNNLESIIVMKKGKSGALFFFDAGAADNTMQRHGFDFAFTVPAKDLSTEAEKILKEKTASVKKTNQGG